MYKEVDEFGEILMARVKELEEKQQVFRSIVLAKIRIVKMNIIAYTSIDGNSVFIIHMHNYLQI